MYAFLTADVFVWNDKQHFAPKTQNCNSLSLNIFQGVNVSLAYVMAPLKLFLVLFPQECVGNDGVFGRPFSTRKLEMFEEESEDMELLTVE